MRALLLAAIAATTTFGMIGCVGDLQPGGPGGVGSNPGSGSGTDTTGSNGGSNGGTSGAPSDTARIAFNNNVYPIISAKCAGCHTMNQSLPNAPGFVDPTTPSTDEMKAWQTVTGLSAVVGDFSTTAAILTLPLSGHEGTSYTATEKSAVTDWLNLETQWRSAQGGTQPVDLIKQWSGCMTLTDFQNDNVASAWAQVQTNEGTCDKCHVNGQGNFLATRQSTSFFQTISTQRAYLMTYFTIDTTATPNKVIINTAPFESAATGGTNGLHPNGWDPTNNEGMQALQLFYTDTMAHLAANACGQPTLTN